MATAIEVLMTAFAEEPDGPVRQAAAMQLSDLLEEAGRELEADLLRCGAGYYWEERIVPAFFVIDVVTFCDVVERGYRICELADGRFSFSWGNTPARARQVLETEDIEFPTSDTGIEIFDSMTEAEEAYRLCAEALADSGAWRAAAEMFARAGFHVPQDWTEYGE